MKPQPDRDGPRLLPHHAQRINASAISTRVARARGYRSVVTTADL